MAEGISASSTSQAVYLAHWDSERICPGRFFAEASIFVMLSNILHTFVIMAPTDANGKPVHNPVEMTDGVVS